MRKSFLLIAILTCSVLSFAQVDNEIGTLKSVAEKLVHAEYFQMDFNNFQFLKDFPEWQQVLILPRMMQGSGSQLLEIKDELKWIIRGGTIKLAPNKKYVKAMRDENPELGSKEYKKVVKKTGGPGGASRQFIYLFGVEDSEAALNILLEKKLILDSGDSVEGTKIYHWIKSPFNNFAKHTAVVAIIPDSSELVMATSQDYLVGQIEARLGIRDLASDHPEYWEELKHLEKYIDPKAKWGVSFGQDVEKELARQRKVLNLSDAEMEKRANKIRFMIPMNEVFATVPVNKDKLIKRSVSTWNLNSEEIGQMADRIDSGKLSGLKNWGKDPNAFNNRITVRSEGNTVIEDTVFDSEYAVWAYGTRGMDHLDEKYEKLKESRKKDKK